MNSLRTVEAERLVAQARSLVPLLRAHAEEAAGGGRLTVEGEAALRDAGLLALQAPRSRGGYAIDVSTAVEVYRQLAHGCSSSAWNAMILSGGTYVASLLGERARDDVWGADPRVGVSMSLAPSGASRRVEGGVMASARCQPLSGVDQSGWVMVHVPEADEDGTVIRPILVLVPISEVSVERTWNVAGMQATGSNTVVLKDVFVPDHRIASFAKILAGGYAADHSEEPLAAATVLSFLIATVMGPVLGMAEAALEHTLDILGKGKPMGASLYRNAVESPSVQFNVAEAASLIDTARLHSLRAVADVEGGVRTGVQLDLPTRARIRMDVGVAAKRAREAVDLLLNVGGARGFALSNPVQRIWRDLETATRHPMLSSDLGREVYARSMLSIEEPVTPWV